MSIRDLKKTELLSKVEALKKGGVLLPNDLLEKVDSINEKWELLGVFAFLLLLDCTWGNVIQRMLELDPF